MKKTALFSLFAALAMCISAPLAKATVIADWSFEGLASNYSTTGAAPGSGTPGPTAPFAADSGTLATTSFATGSHATAASVWSSPAGNGSPRSLSANNWLPLDYFQFTVPGDGTTSTYYVTADANGSATGPKSFKLQYSTDGTTFTDVQSYTIPAGITWSAASTSYAPASNVLLNVAVNPGILTVSQTLTLRLTDTSNTTGGAINGGNVGTAGTSRVDNVIISDAPIVPEPTSFVILGLGLVGFVGAARYRKRD